MTKEIIPDSSPAIMEDPQYLATQLITYLGNKRALTQAINTALSKVREEIAKPLTTVDLFAGSGVVSRIMKGYSHLVMANDLERYCEIINTCYLTNVTDVDLTVITKWVDRLNALADAGANPGGFIQKLYAPTDDQKIQQGERAFYTTDNARRLDFFAQEIPQAPADIQALLYGPLLSSASVHANTSGVFKGFYKDKATGIGKYGAAKGDALTRILAPITLDVPVLSRHTTRSRVFRQDANELVRNLPHVDLAYIDSPYNQHPYGSNYFMLNLLVDYQEPTDMSEVSGIPVGWNRSKYNVRQESLTHLHDLVSTIDASYLLISFNAEGFIPIADLRLMLESIGTVEEVIIEYNTFRGSRNLRERNIHVNEHLLLVRKQA
ncbi:MAG: DNA adenine methylase [Propionibacteriaceae bacterium]|jgi:adenine-specific DNA-methyltransferase|nr:DNA adenine methylase [Propionibacteriaceae bacterium]